MFVNTGLELINVCKEKNLKIWEYGLSIEIDESGKSKDFLIDKMNQTLQVMKQSANLGLEKEVKSVSGLIGGDAYK
ncbi:L-serine ammonia-lyase, iron-sulfur-dependent, subunit alpha, partial [Coprococcus sp. MSK.21.13]|nr:L-serine ammonia-lyase, iron-sulfur-dependent, subunit alpha [Coprococcus sp. MSK.21.13]